MTGGEVSVWCLLLIRFLPRSAFTTMMEKQQISVENKIFYQVICIQIIRFTLRWFTCHCVMLPSWKKSPTIFRDGAPENIKCWLMEHILYSINLQSLKYTIILHKQGWLNDWVNCWFVHVGVAYSECKTDCFDIFENFWLNAIIKKENNHQFH